MDQNLQLEDTVSADRKERIIYVGPGKTRKISSITSRQNFNNEKFTRKANKGDDTEDDEKEKVEESAMQTTGSSQIDTGTTSQSDTISNDKPKKSNNPQIEFVTGTEKAGSASTAIGNAQNMGIKKISEAIVKKAITTVKADKNVGTDEVPFDVDTSAEKEFKKPHNPNRSPMDTVRALAQKAMKKQTNEEVEIDEAIRIKDPIRKKVGDFNYGKKDGSFQGEMERKQLAAAAKDRRKVTAGSGVSGFNSKMTAKPSTTETGRVRAVKEEVQLDEGKMDQIHADIEDHLGKHLADYKANGGAEHFGSKTIKTAQHISKLHGIEQKHAQGLVNQYVDSKLKEETTMSKTYAQFVEQLLEYTPGPGGVTRVQGRSYGAQYHDPEGDDDADDKPAAKADAPKRGRGRPKGATSGANHKVTSGKKGSGVDYTGFKLHLPNSK